MMICTKCDAVMRLIATVGNTELYECMGCGHSITSTLEGHILTKVNIL